MIVLNGDIVAIGSQFSLEDVEVICATIDLEEIRAYRSAASRGMQAAMSRNKYERIQTPFELSDGDHFNVGLKPSLPMNVKYHSPEEEIALSGGVYLYDYLTRSGMSGYLVPLSGGIDSCATSVMVYSMCLLMIKACEAGNQTVIAHVKRIATYSKESPNTARDLCNQIFHTGKPFSSVLCCHN
jgi:NAD+ synthase (glutamine-hydrolysing)